MVKRECQLLLGRNHIGSTAKLDRGMMTEIKPAWEIRRASSTDVKSLVTMRLRLEDHLARATLGLLTMSPRGREALSDRYYQAIADEASCVLVAEEQSPETLIGMAIGLASVREDLVPSQIGRIDDVWVEPSCRRQGICRGLLQRLLLFFEQQGVQCLDLYYTVGNAEAEYVWNKFGFRPVLTVASAQVSELIKRVEPGAI